jgi:hypothetical protein
MGGASSDPLQSVTVTPALLGALPWPSHDHTERAPIPELMFQVPPYSVID